MSSTDLLSVAGLCAIAYAGARLLGPTVNKYERAAQLAALQEHVIASDYYKGYSSTAPLRQFKKTDAANIRMEGFEYA